MVAAYLRMAGFDVDVTPPLGAYPCGPLRAQSVRVPSRDRGRARKMLEEARTRADERSKDLDYGEIPYWLRLVCVYFVMSILVMGY